MKTANKKADKGRDRSKADSRTDHEGAALVARDYSDFVTFNYGNASERARPQEGLTGGPTGPVEKDTI